MDQHKNFAYSAVAVAPSPALSGTTLTVTASDGVKFPAPPFNAVIWPTAVQPLVSNAEVVRVTGIAGDVLTITRAQESSVARTVLVGDQIAETITAKAFTDIEAVLASVVSFVPTTVKTGAYTAAAGDFVPVDTTGGAVTVTLPAAPADNTRVGVKMIAQTGSNAVTIARGGSDVFNKTAGNTTRLLAVLNESVILQYASALGIWYTQASDSPVPQLDLRYDASGAASTEQTRALAAEALLIPLSQKAAASGVASLDGTTKIPVAQLPAGAVSYPFNVKAAAYGAAGNGTTDDTTAIQAAITAAQAVNGTVFFPVGMYRITSTLVISQGVTLRGESMSANYGAATSNNVDSQAMPTTTPFLLGAVLNMRTAATDAVRITAKGAAVNLQNLGIQFGVSGDTTIFQNTGHGIVGTPPVAGANLDQGVMGALWENVIVYGHDGNHTAFNLTNCELSTFVSIQSFGGGGLFLDSNGINAGYYGNCVFVNPYFMTCAAGTAHQVEIGHTQSTLLNLWLRPHCWLYKPVGTVAGLTLAGPTNAQFQWKDVNVTATGQANTIGCLVSPDIENNITGAQATIKQALSGQPFFSANLALVGGAQYPIFPVVNGSQSFRATADQYGLIIQGANPTATRWNLASGQKDGVYLGGSLGANTNNQTAATAAAGAGAGTTPPAPVVTDSYQLRGIITFGTGTVPAAGAQVAVTLPLDAAAQAYKVTITPTTAAAPALQLYVSAQTATGFTVSSAVAPAASQANTVYGFNYHCIS